jgi:hypothetical protein
VFHLKTAADPASEILCCFTACDDECCLATVTIRMYLSHADVRFVGKEFGTLRDQKLVNIL